MAKAAPKDVGREARRLWRSIAEREPEEHEVVLAREAVRTVDVCERLNAMVARDGEMIAGRYGPKPHPALVELRHHRIVLARILGALRIPDSDESAERPRNFKLRSSRQRRVGVRGVYQLPSAQ